jgi:hypothetical protein
LNTETIPPFSWFISPSSKLVCFTPKGLEASHFFERLYNSPGRRLDHPTASSNFFSTYIN